ncbi:MULTISPECIES: ead/Ea22-like family protein [Enterobacter]|uniref:ead/Ea22-like family protein n=1 Tax=Enterobacter TaxID=547 RepID=UPI0022363A9D|nr:ead/Ea22-like family protein [Enterobacter mori]MCW4985685.1 ead/Ea22-like family protein [Enterobacter mori]
MIIDKQALRKLAVDAKELAIIKRYTKGIEAQKKFIASANPVTVLALLDELEAKDKRIAELSSAVIAPGIMRCAGCGFVLTKNSINMAAGTITAGNSKTEPCPNGCGPLWPVTWKEQAIEMRDSSEQWFEELQEARHRIVELTEKPIGWTDEQELRDVEKIGCGYLFNANPIAPHADPRRVILLYAAAAGKGE